MREREREGGIHYPYSAKDIYSIYWRTLQFHNKGHLLKTHILPQAKQYLYCNVYNNIMDTHTTLQSVDEARDSELLALTLYTCSLCTTCLMTLYQLESSTTMCCVARNERFYTSNLANVFIYVDIMLTIINRANKKTM